MKKVLASGYFHGAPDEEAKMLIYGCGEGSGLIRRQEKIRGCQQLYQQLTRKDCLSLSPLLMDRNKHVYKGLYSPPG